MKKLVQKSFKVMPKATLLLVMLVIGSFTVFATANTYEVVAKKDVPFSSVIEPIILTTNAGYNDQLLAKSAQNFNAGNFGVPKKIKFAEGSQHLDIISAQHSPAGWIASQGLGQTFLLTQPQQKIFGEALIYLRYNTSTTQHLGDTFTGDTVNIVTTEGWLLGYQVQQTANDPSVIDETHSTNASKILVVMVDDKSGAIKAFSASLIKVGERV